MLGLALILVVSTVTFVNANEKAEFDQDLGKLCEFSVTKSSESFESSEVLSTIGEVSYKVAVRINDKNYNLYPTFDDPAKAVDNVKERCSEILAEIQDQHNLDDFNVETAMTYYEGVSWYDEDAFEKKKAGEIEKEAYKKIRTDISYLKSFFDIFENDAENEKILKEIRNLNGLSDVANVNVKKLADSLDSLKIMLPYNTGAMEAVDAVKESIAPEVSVMSYGNNSKFVEDKGTNYAKTYANGGNVTKYQRKLQDCTNFTSQIKHEGGVPVYKKYTDSDGWNYYNKGSTNLGMAQTDYSVRWVNADSFVKFFGVKSKYSGGTLGRYTAFVNFSKAIKAGSFIAFDEEGDGSWDHNAYVTTTRSTTVSYHGSAYKDFRVAQHTTNYWLWVSDDDNHWEELSEDNAKATFAIVN